MTDPMNKPIECQEGYRALKDGRCVIDQPSLDGMSIHLGNPLINYIFGIVLFIIIFIMIDIWCCMSNKKKPYVPYYLQESDKEIKTRET